MLKYIKVSVIIIKINIKSLIDNINTGLNTNIANEDIYVLSAGESKSLIFQINEEYLYKIYSSIEETLLHILNTIRVTIIFNRYSLKMIMKNHIA